MAWYIGQSLPMMVVAFLTGLLVGYLLWGRRYRRLERAEAVRAVDPATVLPHRGAPAAGTPSAGTAGSTTASVAASTAPVAAAVPDAGEPVAADVDPADDEPADDDPAADEDLAAEPDGTTAEPVAALAEDDDADEDGTDDGDDVDGDAASDVDGADQDAHDAALARWTAVDEPAPVVAVAVVDDEPAHDGHDEPPTAAEIAALADHPALADTAAPDEAEPESLFAAAGQPEPAAPAPVTTSDRLERVEGIGPKIALALRTAGIRTFEDLAGSTESTLRDALADANLRFAPSLTTWAQQARLLADGDHEGHAALTQQLVAGRAPKAQ